MPAPFLNFQPRGAGWDRPDQRTLEKLLRPNEVLGWQPGPEKVWPRPTEPGGSIPRRRGDGMNGMGDMFVYPQGTGPQEFYNQQIETGAMPSPEFVMDEAPIYGGNREGSMAWETAPAPWELPSLPAGEPPALSPSAAPAAAAGVEAEIAKAKQAAQAAKVAADNAVRAAHANAPKVAATNAATAQAAANVAAAVAKAPAAQHAAAVAQNEATKAVAAANVAAKNNGMGDWLELSGLGAGDDFFSKYKWYLLAGVGLLGAAWYTKGKYW